MLSNKVCNSVSCTVTYFESLSQFYCCACANYVEFCLQTFVTIPISAGQAIGITEPLFTTLSHINFTSRLLLPFLYQLGKQLESQNHSSQH